MANENRFEKLVPTDKFFGGDLKVLICYMLSALDETIPVTETTQLFHYEGIANYFDTQTAIYELEKEGYIEQSGKENDLMAITEKGKTLSDTLKDSVSAVLREKVYAAVVKMLARYKAERDTDIKIEQKESGFLLTYSVSGGSEDLISFSIMLPNMAQAKHLKEHILKNPKYYCDSFIDLLTENM
jgi:predicted transcriptional regulator